MQIEDWIARADTKVAGSTNAKVSTSMQTVGKFEEIRKGL